MSLERIAKEAEPDWRALLKKYIEHAMDYATDWFWFINDDYEHTITSDDGTVHQPIAEYFTPAEWSALKALAEEE